MKVLARLLRSASRSNMTKVANENFSDTIFTATKHATNNVSRAVKVSDEEIEKLMSQGVVPMEYTFRDIIRITGQKIITPFVKIKDCACYLFKRKFGKPEPVQPPVKITEAELPDCLKGIL